MTGSSSGITLKEMAQRLGLTPRAVSQALRQDANGTTRVAKKTVARVRALADQGGYRLNTSARALRTRRFRQVGILVEYDFENRLPPMVETPAIFGMGDYLNTQGWHLVILQDNDSGSDKGPPSYVREHSLDGLVLCSHGLKKDEPRALELRDSSVPYIWFNNNTPTNAVGIQDIIGAELATRHLVELGHRRIIFVGGSSQHCSLLEREEGYRNVMKSFGLEPIVWKHEVVREKKYEDRMISREDWNRRIIDDMMPKHRPTAIVCYSDIEAINLTRILRSVGLSIPGDVSVVGYNDVPFVDIADPPLTTMRADFYLLGRMAGEMLLELLQAPQGERKLKSRFLCPQLIIRNSTGPAPGSVKATTV